MRSWLLLYSSDGTLPSHILNAFRMHGETRITGLYGAQWSLAGVPVPVARHGPYALVGDIRLDNREEVRLVLDAPTGASDETLALWAFECWGEACLERFVGVWSFGIWDGKRHNLFLVEDPVGLRRLYYARRGPILACASEVTSLFPLWPSGRPSPNVPWVREFARWNRDHVFEETAWKGLRSIPPGHAWRASEQGQVPSRYWFFGEVELPPLKREEEHAEHFWNLIQQAVRCRLDAEAPTAVAVSGGLDSTVMLGAAHAEVERGHPAQLRLYNFSDIVNGDVREQQALEAVSEQFPYPLTVFDANATLRWDEIGTCQGQPREQPFVQLGTSSIDRILRAAVDDGCRYMLHGEGGNETTGDKVYRDGGRFLRDWPMRNWPAELTAASDNVGLPIWRLLSKALVPDAALRPLGRAPVGLPVTPGVRLSWAGRRALQSLVGGQACYMFRQQVETGARSGIEFRYPFLDVRLINYMISLPAKYHGRRGVTRWLVRKASFGRVPESVRTSTDIFALNEFITRRAIGPDSAVIEGFLETPMLDQFVDLHEVRSVWRSLPAQEEPVEPFFATVGPAVAIAAWIRHTLDGQIVAA